MKALLETLEVLFGLHVPARWYCVHIIVNITDPIKAVVHIRSPLYHWPRESLCQSCCKLCAVQSYAVVAQPTVIVSAALSFLSPENLLLPCVLYYHYLLLFPILQERGQNLSSSKLTTNVYVPQNDYHECFDDAQQLHSSKVTQSGTKSSPF